MSAYSGEVRKEAVRQYFKYFRFWFIGTAVVLAVTTVISVGRAIAHNVPRGNQQAPAERVYDYADVLTDEEEDDLRRLIAEYEEKSHVDLVLVTIRQYVGQDDITWDNNMMAIADGFYDVGAYGWNQPHGDGALLLDNWYEDENGSQKGSWLSTSGRMERIIGAAEEGYVFDAMTGYIDSQPCKAYRRALKKLSDYGDSFQTFGAGEKGPGITMAVLVSTIFALCYAIMNLRQTKARDTTTPTSYVRNGRPVINSASDDFIRKSVSSHRIQSSSSGGGSRSHSGGGSYGSHHSSGGHSHGGGGRRR